MPDQEPRRVRHWIPLSAACRILEVNESTMRQWADTGRIRAFRTPGGHRRFSQEEVYALLDQAGRGEAAGQNLEEQALRRIRRRLHTGRAAAPQWLEGVEEQVRTRMRLFGRRLLSVATEYVGGRRRRLEVLQEARVIGREQGREMLLHGLSLGQVMEAYVFFRNSLVEVVEQDPGRSGGTDGPVHTLHQVNQVADEVLLGITEAFEVVAEEATPVVPTPSARR